MAPPVLLVADDLSTIAAVKRVLGREGYEFILATSAADAVIAWGHHLPGLVVLQPSVESERGAVVLEELQQHPDAQLLRVVLLGESIPGFPYHVEPLPLDAEHFLRTVQENLRAVEDGQDWSVTEPSTERMPSTVARLDEPEPWRATRPPDVTPSDALPQTHELIEEVPLEPAAAPTQGGYSGASPSVMVRLFGDLPALEDELHRDVEAQAMASVESSLPPMESSDEELRRLEDDVRAEAARRRAAREAARQTFTGEEPLPEAALTPPDVEPLPSSIAAPPPAVADAPPPGDETSFADVTTPPDGAPDPTARHTPAAQADPAVAQAVLSRAEAIALEGRAVAQAQRQTAEAEARRADAELEALRRRAEHAESLVRREREARAAVEDQIEQQREELRQLSATLEAERTEAQQRFSSDLEAVEAQAEARRAAQEQELSGRIAQLTSRLENAERALDVTNATAVERAAERESLLSSLTHEQDAARKAETRAERLEAERASLIADLDELKAQLERAGGRVKELTTQLDDERLAKMAVEEQRDDATTRLEKAVAQVLDLKGEAETAMKLASEMEGALAVTKGEFETLKDELDDTRDQLGALKTKVDELERLRAGALTELEAATAARDTLTGDVQRLEQQLAETTATLTAEQARAAALTKDTAALKEAMEGQRARADEAEALAQLSTERLKALEHRQVMNLALPGRRALGVPRTGAVALEQLAQLVSTLVQAQADVRLELGVRGGTRTLWFKKGALHGAESSFDHESLIDRARRDGLIDARQEAELRLLRTATASEQLEAMKSRGLLREIETVPLLQRATEAIALEAFSEESTQYRLSDEPPAQSVLLVAVPRPTLPLLAEALRRAVPADVLLERLGGAEAVCVATDHELEVRALGFSDKERKMLSWVDGEASIEDLTLAAGLKQETAFRALLVAKWLGLIEVHPPERPAPAPSPDLDVRRLEAKYDEVQDADYFTILGLTRGASTEDVQRAFRRLSEEFDPIKYTGHPDASLQQRAQVVSSLLEEAARALEDERRRAEYARHLLD